MVIQGLENLCQDFRTIDNITPGEVFHFMGDEHIYLLTDDDYYINLNNGESISIQLEDYHRSIETLNTTLIINKDDKEHISKK